VADAAAFEGARSDGQVQVLEAHNIYRCMHGALPLGWDESLEAHAKQWIVTGRGQRSPPFLLASVAGFDHIGENIASGVTDKQGSKSARGAVQTWYDEIKNTEGGRGRIERGSEQTARYSQLVWQDSVAMGCALHNEVLVCQYGPAGNVPGEYTAQVKEQTRTEQSCRLR
jgi:hypothetical protein